jgi:hypothetical protein
MVHKQIEALEALHANVAHYPEGKQGWVEAGLPVEKAA